MSKASLEVLQRNVVRDKPAQWLSLTGLESSSFHRRFRFSVWCFSSKRISLSLSLSLSVSLSVSVAVCLSVCLYLHGLPACLPASPSLDLYPFHPRAAAVARKRSRSFQRNHGAGATPSTQRSLIQLSEHRFSATPPPPPHAPTPHPTHTVSVRHTV